MESDKSLDKLVKLIAALLHDVQSSHGDVFNIRALRLTLNQVNRRTRQEGIGFLTKTLPRLGKAFDKALSGNTPLNAFDLGWKPLAESKLPRFLGEFFKRVLNQDGEILPVPCAISVRVIRQVLYLCYKYELPYSDELRQKVLDKFERTEQELSAFTNCLDESHRQFNELITHRVRRRHKNPPSHGEVIREARILLSRLFASFDPTDIIPRHGPGAVATKQQLWAKYLWTNVSAKITSKYPLDAYFYASLGHVCDRLDSINRINDVDLPARVILVPKDSRGPRLISCEPVDYQWIQQGLGRAIVELVEHSELTKFNVFFTDQMPNRIGALFGSSTGRYATLDLNEASDRVSLGLVRLLFPEHIFVYLEACRSSSTVLPDGKVITLNKFAPMGSCLCFPILALTVWAILTASAPDTDARESIHVYGDDVIVTTASAVNAIEQLESFGLKVNRDKSCISGLFRESCGMDAFNGVDVTPVRLRTVWSSFRSPESYSSWIAYANSFWDKKYYRTYDAIVEDMVHLYGPIPSDDMHLACPSLRYVPEEQRPKRKRVHKGLQKLQWHVLDVKSPSVTKSIDGWSMLLRYFVEKGASTMPYSQETRLRPSFEGEEPFSVSQYTRRRASMLVRRWR